LDDQHNVPKGVRDYGDVAAVGVVGRTGIEGGVAVGEGVFDFVDLDELFVGVALVENFPDVVGGYAFRQYGFVERDFEAHSVDEGSDRRHELRFVS